MLLLGRVSESNKKQRASIYESNINRTRPLDKLSFYENTLSQAAACESFKVFLQLAFSSHSYQNELGQLSHFPSKYLSENGGTTTKRAT